MSDLSQSSPWVRLFGRYLREQGLPVTRQRQRIAEVVFSSPDHLSVDEIEQRLREDRAKFGKAT
ncbi:MAG: transcriptional repressor, partial [Gemmatimonadetes bacterium]|nr:transcriptional repressor [Gemmatimonadota bacterium]